MLVWVGEMRELSAVVGKTSAGRSGHSVEAENSLLFHAIGSFGLLASTPFGRYGCWYGGYRLFL